MLQCTWRASPAARLKLLTRRIGARACFLTSFLALCRRGRCVQGGLLFTVMPAGRLEDGWWLTAPLVLQYDCCVRLIFLPCRLVCLSQFKISREVSAFIEYLVVKIPSVSPIRAQHRLNGEMVLDWMSHRERSPFPET